MLAISALKKKVGIYKLSTDKQSNEGRHPSVGKSNFTGELQRATCDACPFALHTRSCNYTVDRVTPVPLLQFFQLVAYLYSRNACGVDD